MKTENYIDEELEKNESDNDFNVRPNLILVC